MAVDRENEFLSAERQLRQGKVQPALEGFRRVADDAPRDTLMLNRIGDALSRFGRNAEAIEYYERAADQFTGSGFYPKAVAILKKVVKLDPRRLPAQVRLGELHLRQKHPGEARACLLPSAQAYLRAREFAKARDVYEKLAAAEPDDPEHRIRLAEVRAAEGDTARAAEELSALGAHLAALGRHDGAENAYRRAIGLHPGAIVPVIGLARSLATRNRNADAIATLEAALARSPDDPMLVGATYEVFEQCGDGARVQALLKSASSQRLPEESLDRALRDAFRRGSVDGVWTRAAVLIDRWKAAGDL